MPQIWTNLNLVVSHIWNINWTLRKFNSTERPKYSKMKMEKVHEIKMSLLLKNQAAYHLKINRKSFISII